MDGMHDLGGRQGFGPVRYTVNARAFHAPWEVRVNSLYAFAVRLGIFNMDEYRHAIERMEPRHYLTASYYERSLTGLATLLVEKGVLTHEGLEVRKPSIERTGGVSRSDPRETRQQGPVVVRAAFAIGWMSVGARSFAAMGGLRGTEDG